MTGRGSMAGCSTPALTVALAEAGATAVNGLEVRPVAAQRDQRRGCSIARRHPLKRQPPTKYAQVFSAAFDFLKSNQGPGGRNLSETSLLRDTTEQAQNHIRCPRSFRAREGDPS
jgi:hypothetical protein